MKLEDIFLKLPGLADFLTTVAQRRTGNFLLTGIQPAVKAFLLVNISRNLKRPLLVVEDNLNHAQDLYDQICLLTTTDKVNLFPVEETAAAQAAVSSPQFRSQRINTLAQLRTTAITITTGNGMLLPLLEPTEWRKNSFQIAVGNDLKENDLAERLTALGYLRQQMVVKPGDFSIRGSIIDVFPLTDENPIRIDLFDTQVDSLRRFSINDQRSIENIEQCTIYPATEYPLDQKLQQTALERLAGLYQKTISRIKDKKLKSKLKETFTELHTSLSNQQFPVKAAGFREQLLTKTCFLKDYFEPSSLTIWDDFTRTKEVDRLRLQEEAAWQAGQLALGKQFAAVQNGPKINDFLQHSGRRNLFLSLFQKGLGRLRFVKILDLQIRTVEQFFGQLPLLKAEIKRWQQQDQTVVFAFLTEKKLKKFAQTLEDFGVKYLVDKSSEIAEKQLQLTVKNFSRGFELPQVGLIVVTENELFLKNRPKRVHRATMENTERLKSYTDLKKGDYVVHVNHGIGRFWGIKTLEVGGKHHDYLMIEYRDQGKLFVPIDQIERVQKYVSAQGRPPQINKLGNSEWVKTKRKVASKVEDIADDLMDLYAKREMEKGFAFLPDDELQQQFEAAFPYTETPDQLRSAAEIKHDMQQTRPMDRLLIGDVGYGKTEVALRAAFKAVASNKQVAFLVPTTVLAQQHYETMLSRFTGFPVKVGILSRFRTTKQIKETLDQLATGQLDIVVGTHRLLSADVHFKDLGLLIIDEEQRFGVKHKEKIKKIKSNVDVLTLTATPIPRTLNMSMLKVRDLSVIETPPLNRFPIQTYVVEQDFGLIADVIKREINRSGQAFYLHNRVADIERTVSELKSLIPQARIGYIHGQMSENQLEQVLFDFISGEYDVLVTTTIIESGVDMPNVNTLIVEDADKMGLSQLYQLRGRVGRSNRVAYAYFMYRPNKVLTQISEKRLEAIKDFTELGSGFKIAMRDLAIRGAGNLLGKEQHGFIDAVGYDLYVQMLKAAVAKKQKKPRRVKSNAEIEINLEAYLPASYISDQQQKIEIYQRIRGLKSQAQFDEVQADLLDRFGDYPQPVANLLEVGKLKMLADAALVKKISQKKTKLIITFELNFKQRLSAQSLLQAIAVSDLKAVIKNEANYLKIEFYQQPQMTLEDLFKKMEKLFNFLAAKISPEKE
jgi:transcription-repair coupling factor (superfamily II helicase)